MAAVQSTAITLGEGRAINAGLAALEALGADRVLFEAGALRS